MTAPTISQTTEVWGAKRVLFSRKETALLLNLSLSQIKRLLRDEHLRASRIGRRVLIHRDEVKRFAENTQPYMNLR